MGFFKQRRIPVEAIAPPEVLLAPETPVEEEVELEIPAEPHPLYGENYEPHFPRTSITRRVLGHITPEVDKDEYGPRNTVRALSHALINDVHTEIDYPEQVRPHLERLIEAGLVTEHAGTYQVTDAGWRELMN